MKLWQDQTIVNALQCILEDFPYLEYDEAETKRPSTHNDADMLKIKITDSSVQIGSSGTKIAIELSKATGRKFQYISIRRRFALSQTQYLTIMEMPHRDREGTPKQKGSQ